MPYLDKQDSGTTITYIAICLAAARQINTFSSKTSNHYGCSKILHTFNIHGPLFKPSISFQKRVLLYIAAQLYLLCGYQSKTISDKVRNYVQMEMSVLGTLPALKYYQRC